MLRTAICVVPVLVCAGVAFGQPEEACCLPDGSCVTAHSLTNECASLGGDPHGPGTDCDTVVCRAVKWSQPPMYVPTSPHPECYLGWDVSSDYEFVIVADDWVCADERPVTEIHWWGSYQGWGDIEPPPIAPDMFHIGVWTDVAAGVDQPFSHPGVMIFEWTVAPVELNERPVGCDFLVGITPAPDTCFRYDFAIPEAEWFQQEGDLTIYWLSISAVYFGPAPTNEWGWTIRPRDLSSSAPDAAVEVFDPVAPTVGSHFVAGWPIEYPTPGDGWDAAFVLSTNVQQIPTVSAWGNVVMVLLGLVAGTVMIRRRQAI